MRKTSQILNRIVRSQGKACRGPTPFRQTPRFGFSDFEFEFDQMDDIEWEDFKDEIDDGHSSVPLVFLDDYLIKESPEYEEPEADLEDLANKVETMIWVPNVDNFLLVENKLKKFIEEVSSVRVKMKLYLIYSRLNQIRIQNDIDSILQMDNEDLTGAHLELKRTNEMIASHMYEIFFELNNKGEFGVVKDLLKFLDMIGLHLIYFAPDFLEILFASLNLESIDSLLELSDYLQEKAWDNFEYGGFLYRITINELQVEDIGSVVDNEKKEYLLFTYKNINFHNEPEAISQTQMLKSYLNLPFLSDELSLESALERNQMFQSTWDKKKWYQNPEKLDFRINLNQVTDQKLNVLCELNDFMDQRINVYSRMTGFQKNTIFLWKIMDAMKHETDPAAIAKLLQLFQNFQKMIFHLRIDNLIFNINPSPHDKADYEKLFERLCLSAIDSGSLDMFVFQNFYLIECFLNQKHPFNVDKDIMIQIAESFMKIPLNELSFLDQNTCLNCILDLLPFYYPIQNRINLNLLKKYTMLYLSLETDVKQNKKNIDFFIWVLNVFRNDQDMVSVIINYMSQFLKQREVNLILDDINVLEIFRLLDLTKYIENLMLVNFLIYKQGFLYMIRRTELYKIFKFLSVYSICKSFGLSNSEFIQTYSNIKNQFYDCFDDESILKFQTEIGIYYQPKKFPQKDKYFVTLLLLDESLRHFLEVELDLE